MFRLHLAPFPTFVSESHFASALPSSASELRAGAQAQTLVAGTVARCEKVSCLILYTGFPKLRKEATKEALW